MQLLLAPLLGAAAAAQQRYLRCRGAPSPAVLPACAPCNPPRRRDAAPLTLIWVMVSRPMLMLVRRARRQAHVMRRFVTVSSPASPLLPFVSSMSACGSRTRREGGAQRLLFILPGAHATAGKTAQAAATQGGGAQAAATERASAAKSAGECLCGVSLVPSWRVPFLRSRRTYLFLPQQAQPCMSMHELSSLWPVRACAVGPAVQSTIPGANS
jgi:hypothetical protein